MSAWSSLARLLVCPTCSRELDVLRSEGPSGILGHERGPCLLRYPVIDGVPRLLRGEARAAVVQRHIDWFRDPRWADEFVDWDAARAVRRPDLRLVARFDAEWGEFGGMATAERAVIFDRYFDLVPAASLASGPLALDAGCGSGRWADELSRRGARVVAMDLGLSVEGAARNTTHRGVECVQADVRDTPFRPGTFDLAYSLGVLHHVDRTDDALRAMVRTLRPGGRLLLYLYHSLEGRPRWYRALFRVSDILRRLLSALPHPLTRSLTAIIAALVYWPLARLSRLVERAGLGAIARALPLSFYRDLSFRTMRNDSLDRFGTSIEKRYTREEVVKLLSDAGMTDVIVSPDPPYWHAVGTRPPQ